MLNVLIVYMCVCTHENFPSHPLSAIKVLIVQSKDIQSLIPYSFSGLSLYSANSIAFVTSFYLLREDG